MDWALLGLEIVAIMAFCSLLDWFTSRKEQIASKDMIVGWYVRLDEFNYRQSMNQSIAFCNRLFDRIYGKRHFSWRCILVSCAISITSVCLIASFTEVYQQKIVKTISKIYQPQPPPVVPTEGIADFIILELAFVIAFFLALIANPLADYISLIETRYLLRRAAKGGLRYLPLWLLLDVFLTVSILLFFHFLIAFLFIITFGIQLFGIELVSDITLDEYLKIIKELVKGFFYVLLCLPTSDEFAPLVQRFRPVIWSTFSTSIIFYIYCLCALVFKLLGLAKTRLLVLLQRLEENDKLFKGIGTFISACLIFSKATVTIVQHIGQGF